MLIFIYGQDTYRSRQKLKEIIEYYRKVHKSGLNFKYFDAKGLNFEDFQDETQQTTIFCEKKLIILKNVFSDQTFKEKLLKNFKKFISSQEIFLFHEITEIPKGDNLFRLLEKHGKTQEFKSLEGQALKNWVKKEIEKYKIGADSKVIAELVNLVGNDSWQIINEIQKLASYRKSEKIRMEDLELLVRAKIEPHIFRTIDDIASKNKRTALQLLREHSQKGDSPLQLLRMINFQFRNLLLIKSWQAEGNLKQKYGRILSKELKIHPFVIRKSISQTSRFSFEELKKIYQKILKVDSDIKTGKIEPEMALDLLITEI